MPAMFALVENEHRAFEFPDPRQEVIPGIPWGNFDCFFTPAFWKGRTLLEPARDSRGYRLGASLGEEVAACLLGGYGIPAEVGLAAFNRLRESGVLEDAHVEVEQIESLLREPLLIGRRLVRYRFPRQKARYLFDCLEALKFQSTPSDARALRDRLRTLPGVGPKTASWITRNWLASDDVAIIDVHIHRACVHMGVFDPGSNPTRDYFELENAYLAFCHAIDVRASLLDAVMWGLMRSVGHLCRI